MAGHEGMRSELHNYQSSSGTNREGSNEKADLSATPMVIHSTPENLPHASGDASHHSSGMSNSGPVKNDDKIKRQRTLTSREELTEQAQQLIDKINEKRKRDTDVLDNFRKVLQDKVTLTCSALEERMYRVYETSGKNMQPKLQEFFTTLDRVETIEQELQHFKEALGALYTDIQQTKP